MLDWLTAKLTAARTFQELLDAEGHYRPTLLTRGKGGARYEMLAEAYDLAQRERGNPKRAHRGRSYLRIGRERYSWGDTKAEHLLDGETEASLTALCGKKVADTVSDLNHRTYVTVTCDDCKAKAGLVA
jgi:hypothetical protein